MIYLYHGFLLNVFCFSEGDMPILLNVINVYLKITLFNMIL